MDKEEFNGISVTDATVGLWQFEIPERIRLGNFFGALNKTPDGSWDFTYRFRWYVDDLVGSESKDEKSWYRLTIKASMPEAEVVSTIRKVVNTANAIAGSEIAEIMSEGRGAEYLMNKMASMPERFAIATVIEPRQTKNLLN